MAQLPSAWSLFNAVCTLTDADLTESEVAVMLVLCRFTDPGGINIHPYQRTVATILHVHVKTVTTAMSGLRRKGYLEVVSHQQGAVVHYKFCLAKLGLADPVAEAKKAIFAYFQAQDAGRKPTEAEILACEQAVIQLQELGIDPQIVQQEYDALIAREREGVEV